MQTLSNKDIFSNHSKDAPINAPTVGTLTLLSKCSPSYSLQHADKVSALLPV